MQVQAYIDDSADETHERVVLVGCYLGTEDDWGEVVRLWDRRLKNDGIEYFRSTEYYSLTGQFFRYLDRKKYPKPEGSNAARKLRDDLDVIISTSRIVGTAVCIPVAVYKEVRSNVPKASEVFPESALESAFESLVELCAEATKDHFQGDAKIAFIYDEHPGSAPKISRLYLELKSRRLDLASAMGGLVHLDDKKVKELQAADLAASIAKERFEHWLAGTQKDSLEARLRTVRISSIAYWSREYMLHELQRRIDRQRWIRASMIGG